MAVEVARVDGVSVHCWRGWVLSFFGSPYHAHKDGSAIDLSPQSLDFGSEAPSPVEGKVLKVLRIPAPKHLKGLVEDEHVILLKSVDRIVKVLHVKPAVAEGEDVGVSDLLGRLAMTQYNTLGSPGIHLEVKASRDPKRALRATENLKLTPLLSAKEKVPNPLTCEVVGRFRSYSVLRPIREVQGFLAEVKGLKGYFDALYPKNCGLVAERLTRLSGVKVLVDGEEALSFFCPIGIGAKPSWLLKPGRDLGLEVEVRLGCG